MPHPVYVCVSEVEKLKHLLLILPSPLIEAMREKIKQEEASGSWKRGLVVEKLMGWNGMEWNGKSGQ